MKYSSVHSRNESILSLDRTCQDWNVFCKKSASSSASICYVAWEQERISQQGRRCNRVRPDSVLYSEATGGKVFGKIYDVV